MRVLFIHQPYRFDIDPAVSPIVVPRNLLLLGACLRQHGIEVKLLDMQPDALGPEAIAPVVEDYAPDLVGLHIHAAPYLPGAAQCVAAVKACRPGTTVAVGGIFPSILAEELFPHVPGLDVVVLNEGEETVVKLVKALGSGKSLADVPGIVYRNAEGTPRRTAATGPLENPGSYPFPAYDLLQIDKYRLPGRLPPYVETQRGCPYACKFCGVHYPNWGHTVRYFPPSRVADEVELVVRGHGFDQFFVADDTFTTDRRHALAVCSALIERGLHREAAWSAYTRVDRIDPELLEALYEAGCRSLAIGVEAGSQKALDSINKRATLQQYAEAIAMIKAAGIAVHALFILGFPDVDHDDTAASARFLRATDPTITQFFIFHPTPGTEFWACPEKHGIQFKVEQPSDWYRFDFVEEPLSSTRHLDKGEIIKYLALFNLAFRSVADPTEDVELQRRLERNALPRKRKEVCFGWTGDRGFYYNPDLPPGVPRMDLFRNCLRLTALQYEVLLRCNGDHTIEEIAAVVARLFDLEAPEALSVVVDILRRFEELRIIHPLAALAEYTGEAASPGGAPAAAGGGDGGPARAEGAGAAASPAAPGTRCGPCPAGVPPGAR
ncbi:MAG: B12-binding domain-containing radical SAM protein [Acetobacteraceae bacterium]|nr:B12-binding domain-containing radical SAM protein [Acetobacteraceae bacterium]